MQTLTAQTQHWIRVFALVSVFAVLGFLTTVKRYKMYISSAQTEPVTSMTRLEQLIQKLEPVIVDLSCKQLVGEERRYKTNSHPQVEFYSSVVGVFYWDFRNEKGNWQNVYYNKYATTLTGHMFSNDPGEFRIQFMDLQGNTSEYFLNINTNLRPCIQLEGCIRV